MSLSTVIVALRDYARNPTYTTLNIISITSVLVVSYLGVGYLLFEYSYDTFHKNAGEVYRIVRDYRGQSYSIIDFPASSDSISGEQILTINSLNELPEVKAACQFIISPFLEYIRCNEKQVSQSQLLYTNTPRDFVKIFNWEVIAGSLDDFARAGDRVLLTESVAEKLFGELIKTHSDIIGAQIQVGGKLYLVSAVIKNIPVNSHLRFEMALNQPRLNYWGSRIYIEKEPLANCSDLQTGINQVFAKVSPRLIQDPLYKGHFLQPISEIHFSSSILYELKTPGNKNYIVLVTLFTCFIFIAGCFNYSNITLAMQSKRHRSLGTRKVMGASRFNLGFQMWLSGVLLTLLTLPLAISILSIMVPAFNSLMEVDLYFRILADWQMILLLLTLAIFVGSVASVGPIVSLSGKSCLGLLRNQLPVMSLSKIPLQNYLVVSQFIVLIVITSLSYFVWNQLKYISLKKLGYQTDKILYAYTSPEGADRFQQQLRSLPGVSQVGNGSAFGTVSFNAVTYRLADSPEIFDDARQLYLDREAFQAYGLRVSLAPLPVGTFTLINRTAAMILAKEQNVNPEDLIGKIIITEPEYIDPITGRAGIPFEISGIFDDINLFSLHERVGPYFLTVTKNAAMDGRTIIGLGKRADSEMIALIQSEYAKLGEEFPLQLEFLKDNIDKLYKQDQQFGSLIFYVGIVAIFLAGIGFIGITVFMLRSKVKEIGIKKVLGAGEVAIIKMMVTGYVPLVFTSLGFAWPLAYFLTDSWLQQFAYRIEVSQWIFPLTALFTLVFTLGLIAIISIRAVQANPVDSIGSE